MTLDMTEGQRQALLRFADFESRRIEERDDTTLLVLHLALHQLAKRDPARIARIVAAASAVAEPSEAAGGPR